MNAPRQPADRFPCGIRRDRPHPPECYWCRMAELEAHPAGTVDGAEPPRRGRVMSSRDVMMRRIVGVGQERAATRDPAHGGSADVETTLEYLDLDNGVRLYFRAITTDWEPRVMCHVVRLHGKPSRS